MRLKIFQRGFNYSQDGSGNRLVYHLQGCNMRCPWCANPEGMPLKGVLMTDPEWLVDALCPRGAVKDGKLDRARCADCGDMPCVKVGRSKGIRFSCEEYEIEELISEIERSRLFFYDGGGITLTGGEIGMQFDASKELLCRAKALDIHTCIETNGSSPRLEELFPLVDELIMDCKQCDPEKHRHWTGVSLDMTQRNIRRACASHPMVHVRVPLIGGVNDSPEDEARFIAFFREIAGDNVSFEILRYHEFGRDKWRQCGWDYAMNERAKIEPERVAVMRDHMIEAGLRYRRT